MDIMEANTAAFQTTPHKCAPGTGPNGRTFSSCDKGGCGLNSFKVLGSNAFGPGPSFTINSLLPFNVSTSFYSTAPFGQPGNLTNITTTLTQGNDSRGVSFHHSDQVCGAGYLEAFTPGLVLGMIPTLSVWGDTGSTMQWLDVPPCDVNAACGMSGSPAKFSGFAWKQL